MAIVVSKQDATNLWVSSYCGATRQWSSLWPALRVLGGSVDMNGTVCGPSVTPGYL
jgi:hypothetical protein